MSIEMEVPASRGMAFGNRFQPNETELRRVSRLMERRAVHRLTATPRVEAIANGYRILSTGPDGEAAGAATGAVDIARLEYDEPAQVWKLYARDRKCGEWLLYDRGRQIDALMLCLIADPYRVFWQ